MPLLAVRPSFGGWFLEAIALVFVSNCFLSCLPNAVPREIKTCLFLPTTFCLRLFSFVVGLFLLLDIKQLRK